MGDSGPIRLTAPSSAARRLGQRSTHSRAFRRASHAPILRTPAGSAAASCSAAQIRLSKRESSAPIAPSHQSAIPTLRARSSPLHQLRLLAYLPNLAGDGRPEPDLLGEPRAPQPPLSIPTCSPSCRLTHAAGNATRQRPGTSMSARPDTRRPNGPELSCPAAQATPHSFSRILAGKPRSNFPHASRVSCSELLGRRLCLLTSTGHGLHLFRFRKSLSQTIWSIASNVVITSREPMELDSASMRSPARKSEGPRS
jgi:hypothetical protein